MKQIKETIFRRFSFQKMLKNLRCLKKRAKRKILTKVRIKASEDQEIT